MRSRLCMSVVLGVGLLVPGVAMAADADSIRQAIESYLTEASAEMEDASIAYDDLTVTAAGAGHDVSLKGLAIENDEGLLVDFGDQRFSVEEKGDDFAFSNLALTDSVSVTREQEQKKAVVSWFLKRASGTWSPALKGFKSFDMEMGDVKVTLDEGGESSRQMVATLGDLAIEAVTDEVSDRDWNQASRLSVGPIAVRDPEGDGSLSVAKISIDSRGHQYEPDDLQAAGGSLQAARGGARGKRSGQGRGAEGSDSGFGSGGARRSGWPRHSGAGVYRDPRRSDPLRPGREQHRVQGLCACG